MATTISKDFTITVPEELAQSEGLHLDNWSGEIICYVGYCYYDDKMLAVPEIDVTLHSVYVFGYCKSDDTSHIEEWLERNISNGSISVNNVEDEGEITLESIFCADCGGEKLPDRIGNCPDCGQFLQKEVKQNDEGYTI